MKASIDARYYREAGAFVTKELSRYTLCAIRLEPHPVKGVVIVATNGHTMAIFHDVDGRCDEPFNLFWREWVSITCLDGRLLEVCEDRSVAVIRAQKRRGEYTETAEARFLDLIADAPDIRFPNWQMVIPEQCAGEALSVNPCYLDACSIGDVIGAPVDLFVKDNESQIVITAYGRSDFVGIVMPCRATTEYPAKFLDPLRTPAQKSQIAEATKTNLNSGHMELGATP